MLTLLLLTLPALAQEPTLDEALDTATPETDALRPSRYASVSTFAFLPTAVSLTGERPVGGYAMGSAGVYSGYMPDTGFFGNWVSLGASLGLHLLVGGSQDRLELALGLDAGGIYELAYGPSPFVLPSAFIGYRRQPAAAGERVVRAGFELSGHSLLGVTLSVGKTR